MAEPAKMPEPMVTRIVHDMRVGERCDLLEDQGIVVDYDRNVWLKPAALVGPVTPQKGPHPHGRGRIVVERLVGGFRLDFTKVGVNFSYPREARPEALNGLAWHQVVD